MSRYSTPPIQLNDILRRYLEDIEYEHVLRMENKNTVPFEMFLIYTVAKEEKYTKDFEKIFENFKEYMLSEKILKFPTLLEFDKKYKFNWKDEDVLESKNIDKNNTIEFLKFFPVKVINYKKLHEFRQKYGRVAKIKKEETQNDKTTSYSKATKVLKKGENSHDFRTVDTKTKKIFERLWNNRCHLNKNPKKSRKGNPESFDNFVLQTGLTSRAGVSNKTIKQLTDEIRRVVSNLQRKDKKNRVKKEDKFFITLRCTKNEVLLTVKD